MRILAIFVVLLLTACASPAPAPQDHFYRLETTAAGTNTSLTDGVLLVEPIKVNGLIRGRALVYAESGDSVELERYHYHLWHESPAYMLQNHLADYLRSSGSAGTVTTAHTLPADAVITGNLHQFMHIRTDGTEQVLVRLELRLRYPGDSDPAFQKLYTEYEPVKGRDMTAVVKAFSRALNRIYADFAESSHT